MLPPRAGRSPLALLSSAVDCALGNVKKPALPDGIPSLPGSQGGSCPKEELGFGVFLELGLSNPA